MHVHAHMQGTSPVRNVETTSARSAMSSTTPFSVMADGDGTSASDASAVFADNQAEATGTGATGTASSGSAPVATSAASAFSSLSSGLQAMLLGVGQNGQSAVAAGSSMTANTTSALQAYNQTSLFS